MKPSTSIHSTSSNPNDNNMFFKRKHNYIYNSNSNHSRPIISAMLRTTASSSNYTNPSITKLYPKSTISIGTTSPSSILPTPNPPSKNSKILWMNCNHPPPTSSIAPPITKGIKLSSVDPGEIWTQLSTKINPSAKNILYSSNPPSHSKKIKPSSISSTVPRKHRSTPNYHIYPISSSRISLSMLASSTSTNTKYKMHAATMAASTESKDPLPSPTDRNSNIK